MENAAISPDELTVIPLNKGISLEKFDCGEGDLNEFLNKDAFSYEEKGIARTYVCLYQNNPVGFFSLCTDAIKLSKTEQEKEFGGRKTHPDYPALKIARLAVAKGHQQRHVGSFMVNLVIGKAISVSKDVGCRFVTVDAYSGAVEFYKKLGFVENQEDVSKSNISMRLDLIDALRG